MIDHSLELIKMGKTKLNFPFLLNVVPKRRILIIDDDQSYANKLKIFLESNNLEVIISKSGSNGIYNAIVTKPDIILSEIFLPDIDGLTVLEELNKFKTHLNFHFIYMSRYFLSYLVRQAMELGAEDFLIKPIKCEELLKTFAQLTKKENNFNSDSNDKFLDYDAKEIETSNKDNTDSSRDDSAEDYFAAGFRLIDPRKVVINFESLQENEKDELPINAFQIDRKELNEYEKFNFNELTLIIVNLSTGSQKEAISFRDFLFPIISQNPNKILIDLSQIEFMDSAFTGVLVEASKRFKMYNNSEIRLVFDGSRSTINPFIMEWIQKNFKTYDNLNYAVSCFDENCDVQKAVS